jgi:hypothetical protein
MAIMAANSPSFLAAGMAAMPSWRAVERGAELERSAWQPSGPSTVIPSNAALEQRTSFVDRIVRGIVVAFQSEEGEWEERHPITPRMMKRPP